MSLYIRSLNYILNQLILNLKKSTKNTKIKTTLLIEFDEEKMINVKSSF